MAIPVADKLRLLGGRVVTRDPQIVSYGYARRLTVENSRLRAEVLHDIRDLRLAVEDLFEFRRRGLEIEVTGPARVWTTDDVRSVAIAGKGPPRSGAPHP